MLPPIRVLIDGAHGYLTKDASAEEIEAAIRAVCAGQTHPGPLVQERLVAAVTGPPPEQAAAGACPLPAGLTSREAEVLTLLAAGLSSAGIAPAPVRQQRHREDPHQPDLRQNGGARPRPGGPVRLPDRAGKPLCLTSPARRPPPGVAGAGPVRPPGARGPLLTGDFAEMAHNERDKRRHPGLTYLSTAGQHTITAQIDRDRTSGEQAKVLEMARTRGACPVRMKVAKLNARRRMILRGPGSACEALPEEDRP
jgi:hypothetical protein